MKLKVILEPSDKAVHRLCAHLVQPWDTMGSGKAAIAEGPRLPKGAMKMLTLARYARLTAFVTVKGPYRDGLLTGSRYVTLNRRSVGQ